MHTSFKVSLRFTPERIFVNRRGGRANSHSALQNDASKKGKGGKREGEEDKKKKSKAVKQKFKKKILKIIGIVEIFSNNKRLA